MNDISEKVKEKLHLFEGLYDHIRVVNPIDKKIEMLVGCEMPAMEGTCYDYWGKNTYCSNCISMRAYTEKDTFIKIEYSNNRVILVAATPVDIGNDRTTYVVELLKDISKNGSVFKNPSNFEATICEAINELNNKAIKNGLPGIFSGNNITYVDKNLEQHEVQLSLLKRRIEELRDTLNEICITTENVNNSNLRLNISEYLDELIVDYMKKYITPAQKSIFRSESGC